MAPSKTGNLLTVRREILQTILVNNTPDIFRKATFSGIPYPIVRKIGLLKGSKMGLVLFCKVRISQWSFICLQQGSSGVWTHSSKVNLVLCYGSALCSKLPSHTTLHSVVLQNPSKPYPSAYTLTQPTSSDSLHSRLKGQCHEI
jgi:hypothetical protein